MLPESPSASPTRRAATAGLLLCLAAFALLAARLDFLIDDAFISFRFARNWAEGAGLSYNPGEGAPVEGYSNFLWVAALAGAARLGVPLELASRALSLACGAALIALLFRFLVRRLEVPAERATLAVLAVASSASFAAWSSGGLETMPFALLLFGAFALLQGDRRGRRAPLLAGLCGLGVALIRVEGVAWALALALLHWTERRRGSRRSPGLGAYVVPVLVGFGLYVVFRRLHFGEWTANTVHAKAVLSPEVLLRGLKTTASFLVLCLWPLLALALAPLALRGAHRRTAWTAGGLSLAFLSYDTLVGGDWMPLFRFLAPGLPFLAILLGLGLARLPRAAALATGATAVILGLGPSFDLSLAPRGLREALYFRDFQGGGYQSELERWRTAVENGERFALIGRGLAQVSQSGDSIACGAIGAIGYHSRLRVYDRNGLVSREVARLDPAELGGDSGTAGHDRRVPWSFFAEDAPTWFEPYAFEPAPGPLEESEAQAARQVGRSLFVRDPALRGCCVPEARRLQAAPGIPPGWALLLLRYTPDPEEARRAWGRLLP